MGAKFIEVRPQSHDLSLREVLFLLDEGIRGFQTRKSLVVDGIAGPKTRAALAEELGTAKPVMPKGKGIFVRSVKHTGSTDAMIERVVETGLTWVAFQRIWQYPKKQSQVLRGFGSHAAALRKSGRQVWLWGFPHPGKHVEFVDSLVGAAVDVQAHGIIIDPEAPFIDQPAGAGALMDALMPAARAAGLTVGFTSYGAPWNFKTFPWTAFLAVDFAIPQIYDSENNQGPSYPKKSIQAYKDLGFSRIIPAKPAYNKTKGQLKNSLAATPTPEQALIFWDWYNATQTGLWSIIAS